MASFKKQNTGWEYRLRYKDIMTGKFREKAGRGFATKKEAQDAVALFERKIQQGYEHTTMPLVDYLETFIKEFKDGSVRKNTMLSYRYAIDQHIKPHFQNILLSDLKPIMYQKFLNVLVDQDYSKRTIEIVNSIMFSAMERAIIQGKLERNPCKGSIVRGKSKDGNIKFIDSADIGNFLRAAKQDDYIYYIFYKVLIETGMRKGEAAALQWTDIDMKDYTISINKTLDFTASDPKEMMGDPKTFNSKRIVSMSQSLANDLKFQKNLQNEHKLAFTDLYQHDLNLVLCRTDGSPLPKSSLFNSFRRILKRAQLTNMPIHSLRHTHAVLLLEAGADMKYVQERLGHGSMQITADVYAHVSKKLQSVNMERYENLIKDKFL